MIDNSSGLSVGHITRDDITSMSVIEIYNQKLILLNVKNPQSYIDASQGIVKRKALEYNYRNFGTPICISVNGLNISFSQFQNILTHYLSVSR